MPGRNYDRDNVNFKKICPCFGVAHITQNVDMRSSNNSNLQQAIVVVVRDPTATPPLSTLA